MGEQTAGPMFTALRRSVKASLFAWPILLEQMTVSEHSCTAFVLSLHLGGSVTIMNFCFSVWGARRYTQPAFVLSLHDNVISSLLNVAVQLPLRLTCFQIKSE